MLSKSPNKNFGLVPGYAEISAKVQGCGGIRVRVRGFERYGGYGGVLDHE